MPHLHYRRCGQGPTVVLQHGFLGGADAWLPQIACLSRQFDVIAPDLPGHAGSAAIAPAERIEDMAGAVIDLLDKLNVERFCLVGHSMGGMVAQQIAVDIGQRIDKLVLYGTACSGAMPRRFETFAESAARFERDGLETAARQIGATWFVDGEAATYFPLCFNSGRGATIATALAGLKAMPAWDRATEIADFAMPVLVIGGDRDRSYSLEEMTTLARAIPQAEFCILPGCAHNAHLEKPDIFNMVLAGFLAAKGGSRT